MNKLLTENINRVWSSLIVDELIKNGVTNYYISPGMRNAPLIAALSHFKNLNNTIQIITCMDERAAAYRALGFAKATGQPVVLICTSGTAMANYYPAVIESKKSNLPLVIISADRPAELNFCDDNQTMDQIKLYGNYVQGDLNLGAPSVEVSPLALTSSVSNLIHKALFPQKGPVHFNLPFREPLEATKKEIPNEYLDLAKLQINRNEASTKYVSINTIPTKLELEYISSILAKTKKGLLVIGSLNPYDDVGPVREFIKTLNWTTYYDVSSSLKFEFNLEQKALPTFDHPEIQAELVKNPPETIFHVGGRLTSKHYYTFLKQVPSINLITLSLNKEKEDPSHHTKFRINSDINSTVTALQLELCEKKRFPEELDLEVSSFTKEKIELINSGPLSYPKISKTIVDNIENNTVLYLGNSTTVRSFDAYFSYQVKKQIKIATNRGVSGIEGFIASACGYIDGSNQDVTLILGDVSFIHDLNSLYFLPSLKKKLKIVLINNKSGGIFTLLPINSETDVIDYITSPHDHNFEYAARLVNIDYIRIDNEIDLLDGFKKLQENKNHCILEIVVNNDINKAVYQKLRTIKNE